MSFILPSTFLTTHFVPISLIFSITASTLTILIVFIFQKKQKLRESLGRTTISLPKRTFERAKSCIAPIQASQNHLRRFAWSTNDLSNYKGESSLRKSIGSKSSIIMQVSCTCKRNLNVLYKALMFWKGSKALKINFSSLKEKIPRENTNLLQNSLVNIKRLKHFELNSTMNVAFTRKIQEMRSLTSLSISFESANIDDQSIHRLAHSICRLSNLQSLQLYLNNTSVEICAQVFDFLGQKISNLKQLSQIRLGFPNCTWMTDQKVISLCENIFNLENLTFFLNSICLLVFS